MAARATQRRIAFDFISAHGANDAFLQKYFPPLVLLDFVPAAGAAHAAGSKVNRVWRELLVNEKVSTTGTVAAHFGRIKL